MITNAEQAAQAFIYRQYLERTGGPECQPMPTYQSLLMLVLFVGAIVCGILGI